MNTDLDLLDFVDNKIQTVATRLFVLFDVRGDNSVTFEAFLTILLSVGVVKNFHHGWHCLSCLRQTFKSLCSHQSNVVSFASFLTFLQQQHSEDSISSLTSPPPPPLPSLVDANDIALQFSDVHSIATVPFLNVIHSVYQGVKHYLARENARSRLMESQGMFVQHERNENEMSWDTIAQHLLREIRKNSADHHYLCASKEVWHHLNHRASPLLQSTSETSQTSESEQNESATSHSMLRSLCSLASPPVTVETEYRIIDDTTNFLKDSIEEMNDAVQYTVFMALCCSSWWYGGHLNMVVVATGCIVYIVVTVLRRLLLRNQSRRSGTKLLILFLVRHQLEECVVDWSRSGVYRPIPMKCWEIYQKLTLEIRLKNTFSMKCCVCFLLSWFSNVMTLWGGDKSMSNLEFFLIFIAIGLFCFSVYQLLHPAIIEMERRIATLTRLQHFQHGRANWGGGGEPVLCLASSTNVQAFSILKNCIFQRVDNGSGLYGTYEIFILASAVYGSAVVMIVHSLLFVGVTSTPINAILLLVWYRWMDQARRHLNVLEKKIDEVEESGRKERSMTVHDQKIWHHDQCLFLMGTCIAILIKNLNLVPISMNSYDDTISTCVE